MKLGQKHMKDLVDKLNKASEAYYGGQKEIMSDHEWDHLYDELVMLEKKTGVVLPDSPTHKVSSDASSGKKVKHEYPALSLPKSKDLQDVIKWVDNRPCNLSWKLDGLTLVATYDNGKLTTLVTRGDGEIGNDITHLALAIEGVKVDIKYTGHLVLRGECLISYEDFRLYNEETGSNYENPRNLASGSCNPLSKVNQIKDRHLIWKVFNLVYIEDEEKLVLKTYQAQMKFIKKQGFKTVESVYCEIPEILEREVAKWSDGVSKYIYPVDGLVIMYDDVDYARSGANTGHHSTTGGYAFKWADEEAETVLESVEWSVSVNTINPVAIFTPVRLEGTTVQRASLCNISECERLGVGGLGSKLTVIKANKIIPKVVSAIAEGEFIIPDKCPICESKTQIKTSQTGIKTLVCSNKSCPAKNISKMERFVSKHGFDIKGLSEKRLMDLLKRGLITDYTDILDLASKKEQVITVLSNAEGWGGKSVSNLLTEVEAAKSVKPENLLYSLCIPFCGRDMAKQLLKAYSLDEIVRLMEKYEKTMIMNVIGQAKGGQFYAWFQKSKNMDFVKKLMTQCNLIIEDKPVGGTPMTGMTIVITGSLNNYSSRDELREVIESRGGKVSGSVSAKTDYLINNDIDSTSSKNKRAKDLGVPIISEVDFVAKFGI